jgi:hypothetical protein
MAADMDIEMDLDMGMTEDDLAVQYIQTVPELEILVSHILQIYH